jgi:hypothetical protein
VTFIGSILSNLCTCICKLVQILHFYICFGLCWQIIGLTSLPKFISSTGTKVQHKPINRPRKRVQTKEQKDNQRHPGRAHRTCPVHHRTVSGAPGKTDIKLFTFGNSQRRRAIIHRTVRCTPDSVRCSKRTRLRTRQSREFASAAPL